MTPTRMTPRNQRLARRANQLRNTGLSYTRVAKILKISPGKVWILCNRDRYLENCRDSHARYAARGYVALCDMED